MTFDLRQIPPVEQRVRIIYWLLAWAKDEGFRVWCDEDLIRVAKLSDQYRSRTMCWTEAALIAARQQIKKTGTRPKNRTSRGVMPRTAKTVRQEREAAKLSYSKQKENK